MPKMIKKLSNNLKSNEEIKFKVPTHCSIDLFLSKLADALCTLYK